MERCIDKELRRSGKQVYIKRLSNFKSNKNFIFNNKNAKNGIKKLERFVFMFFIVSQCTFKHW